MNGHKISLFIGCVFIIISCIIGAGMFALPFVGAKVGFGNAVLILGATWGILLYSAFCMLELSLSLPLFANNFSSIAKKTLSPLGQKVANASSLLLLYSLVWAYSSGGSSLLRAILALGGYHPSSFITIPLFTIGLGSFILFSTQSVDYLLRIFMSIKSLLLLTSIWLLALHVEPSLLKEMRTSWGLLQTLPIFLVTLGFNVIIPSLVNYTGKDIKLLQYSLFFGSLIPLLLFISWLYATLGVIPYQGNHGFLAMMQNHASLDGLLIALHQHIEEPLIYRSFDIFSNISLAASFLAIGLALFDYIADACHRKNDKKGRLQTASIAFLPPMLLAIFFPDGFLYALNFAAIAVCTLQLLLPPIMVYQLRKGSFPTIFSSLGLVGLFVVGVILLILSIKNIITF